MTLYDFIALDENAQTQAVWAGVFLESRIGDSPFNLLLYDLGGFYVEVYYDAELNKIEKLRPFKKVFNVIPYMDDIDLGEITDLP